jgi:hypothetical protein
MNQTLNKIFISIKNALPKSTKTVWWLLKIILPLSLLVAFLQYWGIIAWLATFLGPLFSYIGLPGESAVVFISSLFLPLYAPVAIISTLSLDIRETTILAIMCLISHNMFVESTVQRKTGSSAVTMFILRIVVSLVAAFLFNKVLPAQMGNAVINHQAIVSQNVLEMLLSWLQSSGWLVLKISLIVTGLMALQNILKEFNLLQLISGTFAPFMQFMGLSRASSFLWFVAQTLGLTYGSVVMIDAVENNEITLRDANLLNYHIAINHSLLEDTLLFVAIGVPALWIIFPRIILAMIVVWTFRLLFEKQRK